MIVKRMPPEVLDTFKNTVVDMVTAVGNEPLCPEFVAALDKLNAAADVVLETEDDIIASHKAYLEFMWRSLRESEAVRDMLDADDPVPEVHSSWLLKGVNDRIKSVAHLDLVIGFPTGSDGCGTCRDLLAVMEFNDPNILPPNVFEAATWMYNHELVAQVDNGVDELLINFSIPRCPDGSSLYPAYWPVDEDDARQVIRIAAEGAAIAELCELPVVLMCGVNDYILACPAIERGQKVVYYSMGISNGGDPMISPSRMVLGLAFDQLRQHNATASQTRKPGLHRNDRVATVLNIPDNRRDVDFMNWKLEGDKLRGQPLSEEDRR